MRNDLLHVYIFYLSCCLQRDSSSAVRVMVLVPSKELSKQATKNIKVLKIYCREKEVWNEDLEREWGRFGTT